MDIYEVLRTKPHSDRHLARYIEFIQSRSPKEGPLEKHHICPKASDLFPEYKLFKDHPWNRIDLTPREHYIAHLLLSKVFGGSQIYALSMMKSIKLRKPRLGAILTKEIKDKIAATLRGKRLTTSHKKAISQGQIGRKHSADTKAKMSASYRYKCYTVTKNGISFVTSNLKKYCEENNLIYFNAVRHTDSGKIWKAGQIKIDSV